ncbi:MAG: CvpA family protein, partial [Hyphomicrobiales bacterium]|nr:CvpA family protein [Hyphomicrobiales bacterium]
MPSIVDLAVVAVILVSALLAMARGFSREFLSIISWGAAAYAAIKFHPMVLPFVAPYIHKATFATVAAATIVFFAVLIVVTIITTRISDAVVNSKIGALDRSLGFVFGAGRGYLLCVVAYAFFVFLVGDKQPIWLSQAKARPVLASTATGLVALLPPDLGKSASDWLKKQPAFGGAAAQSPAPPADVGGAGQVAAPATPPDATGNGDINKLLKQISPG